jgi:hypothetical protein
MNFYQMSKLLESAYPGYTAVVLFEPEQRRLQHQFGSEIPNGWTLTCDHMTINVGPASDGPALNMLGKLAELEVRRFGISEKAAAVQVSTNVPSQNKLKHITIAFNPDGGTSKDSNDIKEWKSVPTFKLQGVIKEVEQEMTPPKIRPVVPPKPPAPNDPPTFVNSLAGKPLMVIRSALKGKFPHLSDEEISRLTSSP